MGFEAPVTIYKLQFEDYEGLEVKARSVAFGKLLEIADELDVMKNENITDFSSVRNLVDVFGKSLKSWNIERDGAPVPANLESFLELEFEFASDILSAWSDTIGGSVSTPLGERSKNGSQSEAPPMKMETL